MSYSVLWRPAEAGYAMAHLAKMVLDGKKEDVFNDDFEIPTIGKPLYIDRNTVVFDRPMILNKDNIDNFDF